MLLSSDMDISPPSSAREIERERGYSSFASLRASFSVLPPRICDMNAGVEELDLKRLAGWIRDVNNIKLLCQQTARVVQ